MDKEKVIEKLINKTNICREEAVEVLEKYNFNILDAVLELENMGRIHKPKLSVYNTNEHGSKENKNEIIKVEVKKENRNNVFQSLIEVICSLIDKGNNIYLIIARNKKVIIRLPVTVILLLLAFAFYVFVPLFIIGFLFDIEYSFSGRGAENHVINKFLKKISEEVLKRKGRFKKK